MKQKTSIQTLFFLDDWLTVLQRSSITLVWSPNWCTKFLFIFYVIHLLKSSTCFKHYPAHLQEVHVVIVYRCPRRKGQNIGRVFLMLKYTDITQNTYTQSWTVTEIMAREKCGLLAGLRTVSCQLTVFRMSVLDCRVRLQKYRWRSYVSTPLWLTMHVMYSAWNA